MQVRKRLLLVLQNFVVQQKTFRIAEMSSVSLLSPHVHRNETNQTHKQ